MHSGRATVESDPHQRSFKGFDDKILSMYARGMSVRDIQAHLAEIYATEVSQERLPSATASVRLHENSDTLSAGHWPVPTGWSSEMSCSSRPRSILRRRSLETSSVPQGGVRPRLLRPLIGNADSLSSQLEEDLRTERSTLAHHAPEGADNGASICALTRARLKRRVHVGGCRVRP
jgi:hypothetical protein